MMKRCARMRWAAAAKEAEHARVIEALREVRRSRRRPREEHVRAIEDLREQLGSVQAAAGAPQRRR